MKNKNIEFGKRLKKALTDSKKTQRYLAKRLKMSEPSISAYVCGDAEPSLKTLVIIAEECDVTIDWLVAGKSIDELVTGNAPKEENNQISDQDKKLLALIQKLSPGKKELAKIVLKDMAKPD